MRRRLLNPHRVCSHHVWAIYLGLALIIGAGCPRPFDPHAPAVYTSPDAAAMRAFESGRQLFLTEAFDRAEAAFVSFAQRFPQDPLVPEAQLYLGRIALARKQPQDAVARLSPLHHAPSEAIRKRADYFLAVAHHQLGNYAECQALLAPLVHKASPEALPAMLTLLADADEQTENHPRAARTWDHLHRASNRPTEKAYAYRRLEVLCEKLPEPQITHLFAAAPQGSLLQALTAQRLVALYRASGRTAEAATLGTRAAAAAAQHRVFLAGSPQPAASMAEEARIGLLLPFSGRYRAVSDLALTGALTAAGALGSAALPAIRQAIGVRPVSVLLRDSEPDPADAAETLIVRDRVVGLIGALDPAHGSRIAAVADAHQVPFVLLAPPPAAAPPAGSRFSLFVLPSNQARVAQLAATAAAHRLPQRAAILAPETPFGGTMAAVFASTFSAAGGEIIAELTYPPGTVNFVDDAKRLARLRIDTLFVPDSAQVLALIAPALTAAGLSPSIAWKRPLKGRAIQLLATADGLSADLLTSAGRYLQGALLAPGFYADSAAEGSGPLVQRYQDIVDRPPRLIEAFAYDSVLLLTTHLSMGTARSADELWQRLFDTPVQGMTGMIHFSAGGLRKDAPLLYQLVGDRLSTLGT